MAKSVYDSLRPSYEFIGQCIAFLEGFIRGIFPRSIVVMRGSVASGTVPNTSFDFDVDLIFPRSVKDFDKSKNYNNFCAWVSELWDAINRKATDLRSQDQKSLTVFTLNPRKRPSGDRKLECTMVFNGEEFKLDLFPKVLNSKGNVCCMSKNRQWIQQAPYDSISNREFTPNQEAALLLIKQWKLEEMANNTSQNTNHPLTNLKSYHMVLALEKIQQLQATASTNKRSSTDSSSSSSSTSSQVATLSEDIIKFKSMTKFSPHSIFHQRYIGLP